MAKKRDIIVGVIIIFSFVVAMGFMGLMFVGLMAGDDGFEIGGFGGEVGVIELFGAIDEELGRTFIKQLDRWADKNSIEAIVIHINSPGGGVSISQEIYDAVKRAKEKKPVVAAMASVAASGGLYVACAADRIVANPGTVTGSIGVIFQFNTFRGLMDKIGIDAETIKSGELKDVGSPYRSMTKKEELMLRSVVMDTYEQFVGAVAEGRGMEIEQIYPLADGSIFTGLQAYNLGLVDSLGGLYEAIEIAAELAGLGDDPSIVRPFKRRKGSIFDLMGTILRKINVEIDRSVSGPQLLYLYR